MALVINALLFTLFRTKYLEDLVVEVCLLETNVNGPVDPPLDDDHAPLQPREVAAGQDLMQTFLCRTVKSLRTTRATWMLRIAARSKALKNSNSWHKSCYEYVGTIIAYRANFIGHFRCAVTLRDLPLGPRPSKRGQGGGHYSHS
jgi:hypothetical protein